MFQPSAAASMWASQQTSFLGGSVSPPGSQVLFREAQGLQDI